MLLFFFSPVLSFDLVTTLSVLLSIRIPFNLFLSLPPITLFFSALYFSSFCLSVLSLAVHSLNPDLFYIIFKYAIPYFLFPYHSLSSASPFCSSSIHFLFLFFFCYSSFFVFSTYIFFFLLLLHMYK